MCVCVCLCLCVCVRVHVCMCVYECVCVCVYVWSLLTMLCHVYCIIGLLSFYMHSVSKTLGATNVHVRLQVSRVK